MGIETFRRLLTREREAIVANLVEPVRQAHL